MFLHTRKNPEMLSMRQSIEEWTNGVFRNFTWSIFEYFVWNIKYRTSSNIFFDSVGNVDAMQIVNIYNCILGIHLYNKGSPLNVSSNIKLT